MSKKKSGRSHGHYCKICGEYKANEKFSGKGHAAHICKACSRLSAAEKAEAMAINRLMDLPVGRLSASDKNWLENRLHDKRPEVAELAREVYNLRFPYAERNARKKQLIRECSATREAFCHKGLRSFPEEKVQGFFTKRSKNLALDKERLSK